MRYTNRFSITRIEHCSMLLGDIHFLSYLQDYNSQLKLETDCWTDFISSCCSWPCCSPYRTLLHYNSEIAAISHMSPMSLTTLCLPSCTFAFCGFFGFRNIIHNFLHRKSSRVTFELSAISSPIASFHIGRAISSFSMRVGLPWN